MSLLSLSIVGVRIAGIDEAGRGCLAGPVYAAAVILREEDRVEGLNDSKKLSPARRETLFDQIVQRALAWAIARAECEEIDRINIEKASHLAMVRAVRALSVQPAACWVDGNRAPDFFGLPVRTIVGGDGLEPSIMAASILAKVARDREMQRLDAQHPGYGLAQHKGYGTAAHLEALRLLGPCAIHRLSFAPCRPQNLPKESVAGMARSYADAQAVGVGLARDCAEASTTITRVSA